MRGRGHRRMIQGDLKLTGPGQDQFRSPSETPAQFKRRVAPGMCREKGGMTASKFAPPAVIMP